ncbi:hypothetical protein Pint_28484 [Pistacia integerrima]|uniref:Uncharacterized protein n=1 Tax=Pistacia integerrima TaxID=434235 RepID=A0ACC0YV35_9ROSI|nr:hypothetical protein Pint_28484 [Pistacia integerrima]
MERQQVLHMKGGVGEESYAKNSVIQTTYLSKSMSVLWQALQDLASSNLPESVTIAELGCSSGPNTLFAVTEITSIICKRCRELGRPPPDFLVYLNDLPANDFNTVFRSLPDFHQKMQEKNGPEFQPMYICGVPGSFYDRIFSSKCLHIVHSSSSLHWLSQVPPELSDKENPVINKGKIFLSKTSPPAVIKAYKTQFQRDFSSFLKFRSAEVIPEGRMVLSFRARRTPDPTPEESCLLWDYLGEAFQDLVAQGLIEEEKLDTYNTPYHEPYTEDIKAEVEREGSFTLDRMEINVAPWDGVNGGNKYERATTAENMAKAIRAVNESMIESHFGPEIMDRLFQRFIEILAADTKEVEHVGVVVSLIRK